MTTIDLPPMADSNHQDQHLSVHDLVEDPVFAHAETQDRLPALDCNCAVRSGLIDQRVDSGSDSSLKFPRKGPKITIGRRGELNPIPGPRHSQPQFSLDSLP